MNRYLETKFENNLTHTLCISYYLTSTCTVHYVTQYYNTFPIHQKVHCIYTHEQVGMKYYNADTCLQFNDYLQLHL